MRKAVVFTLTGPDRVGIVEEVTEVLLGLDCNVESSRMARLGGEFAILMAVSAPADVVGDLERAFEPITRQGYRVCLTSDTASPSDDVGAGYRIEVTGADHEGIIHQIARGLATAGINIESMDTGTAPSPNSGTPLFTMTALVLVPLDVAEGAWVAELESAAELAGVDVTVSPVSK